MYAFPVSSVPAAFDRGHLYSPTLDLTAYALDDSVLYDYRPGNLFEPMPPALRGDAKAFAWWWNNTAKIDVLDYLGLHIGDSITIQESTPTAGATVLTTWRAGALVRCSYADPSKSGAMLVSRRNNDGFWY